MKHILLHISGSWPTRVRFLILGWLLCQGNLVRDKISERTKLAKLRRVLLQPVPKKMKLENGHRNTKQNPRWSSQVSFQTAHLKRDFNFHHWGFRFVFWKPFRVSSSRERSIPVKWHITKQNSTRHNYLIEKSWACSQCTFWRSSAWILDRTNPSSGSLRVPVMRTKFESFYLWNSWFRMTNSIWIIHPQQLSLPYLSFNFLKLFEPAP